MKRVSLAFCSLVAALTLPAYAGNDKPAAPSASTAPAPAPSARPGAEQPLVAEVLILHATNEQKGIDPRIGKLPELAKPPFSNYDSYQVVDRARLPLKKDAPQNQKLPNGRTLQVRLLDELG